MSIERKANRVLEQAKAIAETVESWAEFSAAVFDQFSGIIAKAFPPGIERQTFYDTDQYKQIQGILASLMKKFGMAAGAQIKEKSGRFVVRIPKTIHQKLDIESKLEGVSLNQLAVTKLSLPLQKATNVMIEAVIEAFNSTHDGYARDWVIVDPHHNGLFLDRCRELGLSRAEYDDFRLNHQLMNISKTSKYKGRLNHATKDSGFRSYEDCLFAAEIAIRTLQRTDGVTLDRTICDPALRSRYDMIALNLTPNQTIIKLRCAALNLRKTHRLQPMSLDSALYALKSAGPIKEVRLNSIEAKPGVYVFYDYTRPIFAGETSNLQERIHKHLDSGLPDWIKDVEADGFILKYSAGSMKKTDRLNWLGTFINKEKPLLNYQRTA